MVVSGESYECSAGKLSAKQWWFSILLTQLISSVFVPQQVQAHWPALLERILVGHWFKLRQSGLLCSINSEAVSFVQQAISPEEDYFYTRCKFRARAPSTCIEVCFWTGGVHYKGNILWLINHILPQHLGMNCSHTWHAVNVSFIPLWSSIPPMGIPTDSSAVAWLGMAIHTLSFLISSSSEIAQERICPRYETVVKKWHTLT